MRLHIDVNDKGGLATGARLKAIGGRAQSIRPISDEVHRILMRAIDYQYGRGGPAVGGWKPDSAGWLATKARLGLDLRVMHATGRLRASLTTAGHEDHVFRATAHGLVISTRVEYATHLNKGGRPPVIISDTAAQRVAKVIRDYIVGT